VLEQRVGEGRALLLALPLDNQFGDFPLQPAFLPFVRQLVLHASGRDAAPLWRTTGERWSLPNTLADPVVTAPDGALIRPEADSLGAAVPLTDAGIYTAFRERASGEPHSLLAVNVAPAESELTPMDTTELLLGVPTAAATDSVGAARTTNAPLTVRELERRQTPWRVLLLLVVVLLTVETWLATRGRRGTSRRVVVMSANAGAATTDAARPR